MKLRNKKTGEIIEYDEEVIYYRKLTPNGHEDWTPYHPEDWEDYVPAEPLIKDEKIRKAIRVWARLNVVKEVTFDEYWHSFRDMDMVISFLFSFRDFDCLEDGKTYTIAELCGEEEE